MANIFYGTPTGLSKDLDKWIATAGVPDVFAAKDETLRKYSFKVAGKYEVASIGEALRRYPDADVWVTYRKPYQTAKMLLSKVAPDKIHFLEADLEYRRGCNYLGHFISYRMNSISPCCITGKAPIVRTTGSIRQRLSLWQDYTTELTEKIRQGQPNACDSCHLLTYGFWHRAVKLDEINLGSNQPGDVCNFRCTYCFCENSFKRLKNATDGLTTYEILQQLAEMPEYDSEDFIVQLANGEFCVNRHCDEMLEILSQTKWRINLLSNLSIYKEKLAALMQDGRIKVLTMSLDAGTRATFHKIKRVDAFDRVKENLKAYPVTKTKFQIKYIFVEGVNDNEIDVNGYYEITKEVGGIIVFSADLNAPFTEKMRDLVRCVIKKAKTDGVKISASSSYLAPQDARFIRELWAKEGV